MHRWIMALFVTLWLAGCSEPPWQTKDISGLMPPLAFELVDENGKDVNADENAIDNANDDKRQRPWR